MNNCSVRSRVISTDSWFSNSSIFGICGLRLMQLSFSFRESNAIFTDLSFFPVITTGDTKQSSSTLFTFSKCPSFINFSNSRPTSSCRCSGIGLVFISPGSVRASVVCLFRYLLLSGCFQKGPGTC